MPKIQDYQVKSSTQITPQTRMAQADQFNPERGIENAIKGVGNVGNALIYRAEQDDVSNLHVGLAKVHEAAGLEMQDQINKGTFKFDDFKQSYENKLNAVRETVKTPAGQNFFDQQSATMHAETMIGAARAQQTLVGDKAIQDYITATDAVSNTLRRSPSGFLAAVELNKQAIAARVNAGLPAEAGMKLERAATEQFAKDTMEGWAQFATDKAKAILDSGEMDKYLGKNAKDEMYGKIKTWEAVHRADEERVKKIQSDLANQQQETTMLDFVKKMENGNLLDKDIVNSNLDSDHQIHMLRLNKAKLEDNNHETQGAAEVDLFQRMHLPEGDPNKITDEKQLDSEFINKNISWEALTRLRGEYQGKHTTQGKLDSSMKATLIQQFKSSITNSNPMMGKMDNIGDQKYGEFKLAVDQRFDAQKKAGKPLSDLGDPSKPEWIGNLAPLYRRTMQQTMQDVKDQMIRDSGRVPPSQPTTAPAMQQFNSQQATLPKTAQEEEARNKAIEQAAHDKLINGQKQRMALQKATETKTRNPGEAWQHWLDRIGEK